MNKTPAVVNRTAKRPLHSCGVAIDRAAERLLAALGDEGAYAFPDPTAPGNLVVRCGSAGISLGRGRYVDRAGEALVTAGLAAWRSARRDRLTLLPAGEARLRRSRSPGDSGYLGQHLDLVVPDESRPERLLDASESPLAWMARRRGRDGVPLIDAACFEAGERLRRDITFAAMLPGLSPDWGAPRVDGGGPRDPSAASDRVLTARRRVADALGAVGADLSGLLIDLCGFLKGLERIESERGWPARSAKVVARIALARLAEHYGIEREAIGPNTGRPRSWRAAAGLRSA